MKIMIESTDELTFMDSVPVRHWLGVTERGVRCHVFVHRIAVHEKDDAEQFDRELKEQLAPGIVIPLRNIL